MSSFPANVAYGYDFTQVEEYTPSQVSGETFIPGDLVVWDATDDNVQRCGADPALILGISEVDSEAARVLTPNGKIPVRTIAPNAVIRLSSTTTLVEATHLGIEYGITRSADGFWQLDTAKTGGDARCLVVRIDTPTNSAYVKFLAVNIQNDAIAS